MSLRILSCHVGKEFEFRVFLLDWFLLTKLESQAYPTILPMPQEIAIKYSFNHID